MQSDEHAAEARPDHGDPAGIVGDVLEIEVVGGDHLGRQCVRLAGKHWNDVTHCFSLPSLRSTNRRAAGPLGHSIGATCGPPALGI